MLAGGMMQYVKDLAIGLNLYAEQLEGKEQNMAKLNKEDFISALKEMTILEVKELVDAMKEEFGVDPSAVAVAAAPAAGEDNAAAANKNVVLKDAGATKIAVIKILKELTGLGLVEAKALADNGGNVKENLPAEEAEKVKAQLDEAGATVELVNC